MWIIQELYLAREFVVWCGDKTVSQKNLNRFLEWMTQLGSHQGWKPAIHGSTVSVHRIGWSFKGLEAFSSKRNNLLSWLQRCVSYGSRATDSRDYIYGLLGVATDLQPGDIVPSYEASVRETFLQALPVIAKAPMRKNNDGNEEWALRIATLMGLEIDNELRQEVASQFRIARFPRT